MYIPNAFRENNTKKLYQHIRDYGFGILVIADRDGIEANHLPFYLDAEGDEACAHLQCHIARGNPVWKRLHNSEVLVIFQGPNAYVSPNWYPTKAETGRAVPTWNYLAIHARGTATIVDEPDWLTQHLAKMTLHHESGREAPWKLEDAPAGYIDKLARGIVGVDIKIHELTGKLKASQNQPQANREGVRHGLMRENPSLHGVMVDLIDSD